MKRLILIALVFPITLLFTKSSFAQLAEWDWVYDWTDNYIGRAYDIKFTEQGGIIAAGNFSDTIGEFVLVKFDENGNETWKSEYLDGYIIPSSLALDANENIYVTGYFWDTLIVGNNTFIEPHYNGWERQIFLIKYDQNGQLIWAIACGEDGAGDDGDYIFVDSLNRPNIVGRVGLFGSLADFGGLSLSIDGFAEIYLARFSEDGIAQMVTRLGTYDANYLEYRITSDDSDYVYVNGSFAGSMSVGGNDYSYLLDEDIFLAKFSSEGLLKWSHAFNGSGGAFIGDIAVDKCSNIHLIGTFSDTIRIVDTILITSSLKSGYYATVSSSGNLNNAANLIEYVGSMRELTVDDFLNVYLLGNFLNQATFGNETHSSYGGRDIFISKLNPNGEFRWTITGGTDKADWPLSIIRSSNNIYVTGTLSNSNGSSNAQFGSISFSLTGWFHGFIAKVIDFDPNPPEVPVCPSDKEKECDKDSIVEIITYPNPTEGNLWIHVPHGLENVEMEIFSITGQLLDRITLNDCSIDNEIDLGNYGHGNYVLRFSNKEQGVLSTNKVVLINE